MTSSDDVARVRMSSSQDSRLLTVNEAAEFLSVSVSTLYGWAWQRRIPFVKMGRALRFDRMDLEKFVNANRYSARNDNPRDSDAHRRVECPTRLAKGRKVTANGNLPKKSDLVD
jgi:excisionase family DNA binding protein